ncbi:hypothetical protein HMPREF9015_01789 [Leptotrichia wadei F0279]|uniref:Uncharacterized protein n=1 Tax=Leptotrichia wadei (strain F0279) TaxID=888055 RepID=U2RCU0_LEPWF|nr:hypothetical protein HMPREF9015_01789 [Leptotrichia wadei F0279]
MILFIFFLTIPPPIFISFKKFEFIIKKAIHFFHFLYLHPFPKFFIKINY